MSELEFSPGQARTENQLVHVLWLTSGLSCDGDTVAMTAATSPSIEDLLSGAIPGTPGVAIYNSLLSYESGDDFVCSFRDAAAGRLDPFLLVLEGSVPNEAISGEGHWAGFGLDPDTGQPITTNTWLDRLAPLAAAVLAVGTCAAYGGIPAMKNNPTGAMGLRDYLGHDWVSRRGLPVVNLPGCPVQPDNITETLLHLVQLIAGVRTSLDLDDEGRPTWLFSRTVHEGCNRAGFSEQGQFAKAPGDAPTCLVKLGCSGPLVKCNVPVRGWMNGMGGCPNVGGICTACTSPGFPDRYMPFLEPDRLSQMTAGAMRFAWGPLVRHFRGQRMRTRYDVEPEWRRPAEELVSGYERTW